MAAHIIPQEAKSRTLERVDILVDVRENCITATT
jgi:hypothetical protein